MPRYMRPLAHALIEAGADLIAGNHPHAINPVEVYQGKPVFYSLGNFIYTDLWDFMGLESLLVRYRLGDGQVEIVPLLIDERGMPRMAGGDDAQRVLHKLDDISTPLGTHVRVHNDHGYLEAIS
jgi:poly-gamma-glutamate capsule biosynthesis protein CapA/YwtB (metallophosphatase superfamily)